MIEKLTAKIKPVHPEFKMPIRSTEQAGAWDVFVTEVVKESEDCYLAKLGFRIEFDPDYKLMFAPRSSLTKTKWNIQNAPGIGDADFRGEYSIRFRAFPESCKRRIIEEEKTFISEFDRKRKMTRNVKKEVIDLIYPEFPYKVGDRCVQIFFQKRIDIDFLISENLTETSRGEGAYGHTGR